MSKGGGGGGVQEVEQTTTNLPEYARPFYENLLDRATYESERGYEGYMAPRLADFDPYEMDAMGGIADMAYRGDQCNYSRLLSWRQELAIKTQIKQCKSLMPIGLMLSIQAILLETLTLVMAQEE